MPAIRRILVAIKDTSARSLPAVEKAAQLARAHKAQLELYHAISEPIYVDALAIAGQTVALVSLIGYSAMAGTVGGGGLGDPAHVLPRRLPLAGHPSRGCAAWRYALRNVVGRGISLCR